MGAWSREPWDPQKAETYLFSSPLALFTGMVTFPYVPTACGTLDSTAVGCLQVLFPQPPPCPIPEDLDPKGGWAEGSVKGDRDEAKAYEEEEPEDILCPSSKHLKLKPSIDWQ